MKPLQLLRPAILDRSIAMGIHINICSEEGDPTHPKTWSGTPANLTTELRRIGRCEEPFRASPPKWIRQLLSVIFVLIYGRNYPSRGPIRRYVNSLIAIWKTHRCQSKHTLHMGTFSLPFLIVPKQQHHYLYIDSTWKLWRTQKTDLLPLPKRTQRVFESLEAKSYQQATHIFSISEYVRQSLMQDYKVPADKITVVGTGRGVIQPYDGLKDYSSKRILFAAKGRFRDKGGHLVIQAFRLALKEDPELQLTILGGDHEATAYADEPNVSVLGFLPIEELQRLFESHALFLMPALNEPWGLVYLEAMACKMPVIGLNRNAFPEISGHGKYGFGLDDHQADSIKRCLLQAFSDLDALRKMGEAAYRHCLDSYSWERTVARIIDKIESMHE